MSDKIKVSRIDIKIGDKTISLTPSEMKELKQVLEDAFPSGRIQYIPSQPIIIDRPYPYPTNPYRWWEVTCNSDQVMCLSTTH